MSDSPTTPNPPAPPRRQRTPIEKLVRLALVALLGVALFPVARIGYGVRQQRNCQANLRNMMFAALVYVRDYDEKYPLIQGNNLPGHHGFGWAGSIHAYVKTAYWYRCPLNARRRKLATNEVGFTDYWMNSRLSAVPHLDYGDKIAKIVIFGEGIPSPANYGYAATTTPANNLPSGTPHQQGANYIFTDVSVKWLRPNQLGNAPPAGNVYTFRWK